MFEVENVLLCVILKQTRWRSCWLFWWWCSFRCCFNVCIGCLYTSSDFAIFRFLTYICNESIRLRCCELLGLRPLSIMWLHLGPSRILASILCHWNHLVYMVFHTCRCWIISANVFFIWLKKFRIFLVTLRFFFLFSMQRYWTVNLFMFLFERLLGFKWGHFSDFHSFQRLAHQLLVYLLSYFLCAYQILLLDSLLRLEKLGEGSCGVEVIFCWILLLIYQIMKFVSFSLLGQIFHHDIEVKWNLSQAVRIGSAWSGTNVFDHGLEQFLSF